jgi:hypothetical protein
VRRHDKGGSPLSPLARGIAIEVGANIVILDDHLVGA